MTTRTPRPSRRGGRSERIERRRPSERRHFMMGERPDATPSPAALRANRSERDLPSSAGSTSGIGSAISPAARARRLCRRAACASPAEGA